MVVERTPVSTVNAAQRRLSAPTLDAMKASSKPPLDHVEGPIVYRTSAAQRRPPVPPFIVATAGSKLTVEVVGALSVLRPCVATNAARL